MSVAFGMALDVVPEWYRKVNGPESGRFRIKRRASEIGALRG